MRNIPITDTAEFARAKHLIDNDDPSASTPTTDILLANCATFRIDMDELIATAAIRDSFALPAFIWPKTEILLPSRATFLIDSIEPAAMAFAKEHFEVHLVRPRIDNVEPRQMKSSTLNLELTLLLATRILSADPNIVCWKTDALPLTAMLHLKDIELPPTT